MDSRGPIHDPLCPAGPIGDGECNCMVAENARLKAEVERLKGPLTCGHDPRYAGGACAICHALWIERAEKAELQVEGYESLILDLFKDFTGADRGTIAAWIRSRKRLDEAWGKIEKRRDSIEGRKE